jgi:hypothetical protein
MKPAFFASRQQLQNKPPHGQPCNNCGLCCVGTLCPLARHVFHHELGPCPALEYDGDQSVCGLVAHPERHAPIETFKAGGPAKAAAAARVLIGAGVGCDARFNGEVSDEAFRASLRQWDHDHRRDVKVARKAWGVRS